MPQPRTIHDFGGFPQKLFEVQYPAPGNPDLANRIAQLTGALPDQQWGLDHGTWSVLCHLYPEGEIPVVQLSIDYYRDPGELLDLAAKLRPLREEGILLMGSGNIVHNLREVTWDRLDEEFGFDWAVEVNEQVKRKIQEGDHQALVKYEGLHPQVRMAIPTPDHYYPLLYVLGVRQPGEPAVFFNDSPVAGALTMTGVRFG